MSIHSLVQWRAAQLGAQERPAPVQKTLSVKSKMDLGIVKRIFLLLVTGVMIVCAVAPSALQVPPAWQPWLFLASIFWLISYFTGMFNS
ncbi:MAG: hypothetical protein MHPDNHAH_02135 [Anaerolineales bacterium]|nr:hypothetical protein [Anaerolineales bacterium]